MYNGIILAEYINLKVNEAIELKWRLKDWKDCANLIITFCNFDDSCTVTVDYANVTDLNEFRNVWIQDIFKRIHTIFNYRLTDVDLMVGHSGVEEIE